LPGYGKGHPPYPRPHGRIEHAMKKATEDEIINHVTKHAQYYKQFKEPYLVEWKGKAFASADTRDLVLQILAYEKGEAD
jgi:hypothetical protein